MQQTRPFRFSVQPQFFFPSFTMFTTLSAMGQLLEGNAYKEIKILGQCLQDVKIFKEGGMWLLDGLKRWWPDSSR